MGVLDEWTRDMSREEKEKFEITLLFVILGAIGALVGAYFLVGNYVTSLYVLEIIYYIGIKNYNNPVNFLYER